MEYADIIARETDTLPVDKQAEVLDFIEFLKAKQSRESDVASPMTSAQIVAFFRSFNVDTSSFKFAWEEANAR